ncbi:hypothetical protein ABG768_004962 [Culter alburnus]
MAGLMTKLLLMAVQKPSKKGKLKVIKWLQKKKLLTSRVLCSRCGQKMKLTRNSKISDGYNWVCRSKNHRGVKSSRSVRTGSLFEKSKISLPSWLTFIYRFSQGLHLRQIDMMQDRIARSSKTLSRMAKVLRKICTKAMKEYQKRRRQQMGGQQEFVVIDESNFRHKRKYGRGRASTTWRRRKWVFGMLGVKHNLRRPILRLVTRRSRNHLIPIIVKHVRPGTILISDEWRAYRGVLANMGYRHFTVNHSHWFVDPNTGAHSQHLERAWLSYKTRVWRLRGNRTEKMLKEHLALIEWTNWLGERHRRGVLGRLFRDIYHQFPV